MPQESRTVSHGVGSTSTLESVSQRTGTPVGETEGRGTGHYFSRVPNKNAVFLLWMSAGTLRMRLSSFENVVGLMLHFSLKHVEVVQVSQRHY